MQIKQNYKYVFVVLVYRNTTDILDFIKSVRNNVNNYKIIIVNSYYDEKSKIEFEKIAFENNCDFLNIENKGYGFGNNNGIKLANKKYNYDFIIISNPDIIIENFDENIVEEHKSSVIGPEINTLSGKKQNPMLIKQYKINERIEYYGFKFDSKLLLYLGIFLNKLATKIHWFKLKKNKSLFKVYQLHGSFLIFGKDVINNIGLPYDEKMFLFAEESYLAYELNKKKVASFMSDKIRVLHKEDGSMSFIKNQIYNHLKKSFIYYYENYVLKNKA